MLILWWMYQANQNERREHLGHMRELEKEVRDKILSQLNENTRAFERVIQHLNEHNR